MPYRVGIIGTGAVADKHAQAYRNIGYELTACTARDPAHSQQFAAQYGCANCEGWQAVCRHPHVDFVDVCTLPDFRLEPVLLCAELGKAVLVEKPIAANLETARRMLDAAHGIALGVVSQHRFDESTQFLKHAIESGRLGRILQADAYVKWHRPPEYYARPGKGTWAVEGGGALITQAIHQADLLLWLAGPVRHVYGDWQLAATHRMESEDIINAVLRYGSGATGVIQAATSFQPGQPERIEIHGTRGTAIVTGDRLTQWLVEGDAGEPPPVALPAASGASNPMAISLAPFEQQFLNFGEAVRKSRPPLVSGQEGYRALELVDAIYRSCREERRISL
jgi:UDP-N-acetyl-2-amino-2-deoxyglucuronate dehydrogenase